MAGPSVESHLDTVTVPILTDAPRATDDSDLYSRYSPDDFVRPPEASQIYAQEQDARAAQFASSLERYRTDRTFAALVDENIARGKDNELVGIGDDSQGTHDVYSLLADPAQLKTDSAINAAFCEDFRQQFRKRFGFEPQERQMIEKTDPSNAPNTFYF